jgi:molybdenum cofactor cytidylyltransferase
MRFGEIPVGEAAGAILAHSLRFSATALKKGRVLSEADIAALSAAGVSEIVAARLDPGDLREDAAADRIAAAIAGTDVKASPAFTGRANLFAETRGLLVFDRDRLDRLNLVAEAVTLGTLPPFATVEPRQMVATVKIIPFAVPEQAVLRAAAVAGQGGPLLRVAAFAPRRVALIQTRLPGLKESILDKTRAVTETRLRALGSALASEDRVDHSAAELAPRIAAAVKAGAELVLVHGASVIVDRRDVIPASVEKAGGRMEHFGMPVDPGNMLLLGRLGAVPVLGLPGCARSPKVNGFDWVLERLCAGVPVGREDIMRMGAGGLLAEIPSRPLPRAEAVPEELSPLSAWPAAGWPRRAATGATGFRRAARQRPCA